MNGCHLEILNILWEISAEGVFSDFFFFFNNTTRRLSLVSHIVITDHFQRNIDYIYEVSGAQIWLKEN